MSAFLDHEAKSCDAHDASFALVDIAINGSDSGGILVPMCIGYLHESVCGIVVRSGKVHLMYVRLDFVGANTPKLMATIGANLSGNLRAGLCDSNHFDYYSKTAFHTFNFDKETIENLKNKIITKICAMETSKITQYHHSFITYHELEDLINELSGDEHFERRILAAELVVNKAKLLGIDNRVSAVTHVVYLLVAPLFACDFLAGIVADSNGEREYADNLKFESQSAKQMQTLFRNDLASIFELQVLRNRVYDTVDWQREIGNRTEPNTVPISYKDVFDISVKIFDDGVRQGQKARSVEWKNYWQMRWASMPVGSVVSQHDEDIEIKRQLPREARIKSAWFCASDKSEYGQWASRKPEIFASTSTKYEWGKVRALYGCDVTSFLHSDFAMINCEDTLPGYFPVGRRANDKYIGKLIKTFSDGVPLCYDYDDFNSQHSTSSMQAVLSAWRHVFGEQLTDEQRVSLQWTIDSVATQFVKYNELGKLVNLNGTLMSGWRLTSFMNTVLNRVYLVKAGLMECVTYSIHNGDDMFAATPNLACAVKMIRNAKEIGVRAQMAKTNMGTIGEFLRVDTRATNPKGSQYLARAVATAVHGRVEMAPANDYREIVRSTKTRMNEMQERGACAKACNILEKSTLRFLNGLFEQDSHVPDFLASHHPLQGGFNKEADIDSHAIRAVVTKTETNTAPYQRLERGINEYANYVVERLGIKFDVPDRKQMFKQMVNSLLKPKVKYEIVIDTEPKLQVYRGLYKMWSDGQYVNEIALARSLGYTAAKTLPGLYNPAAKMIRESNDPIRLMQVIL